MYFSVFRSPDHQPVGDPSSYGYSSPRSPFGGTKADGIGRDGGDYSFDFYMETKNICLAHGTHRAPKLDA